jgi:uncharacterized membrane protein YedE/YeeE
LSDSIIMALVGGALIGLSASALLLLMGRVSGICGIVGSLLTRWTAETHWRVAFVAGLLVGGGILMAVSPEMIQEPTGRSLPLLAGAGLLVGVGTRLANGCTSGHGVCGLSRRSPRSLIATIIFMATGFMTATLLGLFTGGAS